MILSSGEFPDYEKPHVVFSFHTFQKIFHDSLQADRNMRMEVR